MKKSPQVANFPWVYQRVIWATSDLGIRLLHLSNVIDPLWLAWCGRRRIQIIQATGLIVCPMCVLLDLGWERRTTEDYKKTVSLLAPGQDETLDTPHHRWKARLIDLLSHESNRCAEADDALGRDCMTLNPRAPMSIAYGTITPILLPVGATLVIEDG